VTSCAILATLQHALGLDQYGRGTGYRDHFVAGPGHTDYDTCMAATVQGLMHRYDNKHVCGGVVFIVTDEGRAFVRQNSPEPPNLSRAKRRYQEWLDSGAADCGVSFGNYLRRPGV
jgi:hypothetical protein